MKFEVIGYRALSALELCHNELPSISRRGLLTGVVTTSMVGAVCPIVPAAAQGRALAIVMFSSAVLELADRLIKIYESVRAHTEVHNKTTTLQDGHLLATLKNERGLVERQDYSIVVVPPGHAAIVRISVEVGSRTGEKEIRVNSAVDYASGTFEVVT